MSEISVGRVAMVPLSSITLGERARKELEGSGQGETLESLESSMKESGLVSPLAVKELDGGKFYLLAGGRRYTILSKNSIDEVPVRIYPSDITELEIKSIELAENFYRKGFEWWEEDDLISQVHQLQQSIHGTKVTGPSSEGWGMAETGNLLGASKMKVSSALKRTELRTQAPQLFDGCKTQADANKVIKKLNEAAIKEVLAKKIESNKNPNSILSQLSKSFILKDFFTGIKEIPDGMFHLVEIDPPYAINLNAAKKSSEVSKYNSDDYHEISKDEYPEFLSKVLKETYRVMAEHSWLIFWFAPEPWFNTVYSAIKSAGFETTRMCGIWTKGSGQCKRPEIHLANSYEQFFYAWKGRPAMAKPGRINEFNTPPIAAQNKTHPAERPIDLMKEIYSTFALPGSRVLIPFLGSGNGLIAAEEVGMSSFGFEKSSSYRDSFLVKLNNRLKG